MRYATKRVYSTGVGVLDEPEGYDSDQLNEWESHVNVRVVPG